MDWQINVLKDESMVMAIGVVVEHKFCDLLTGVNDLKAANGRKKLQWRL